MWQRARKRCSQKCHLKKALECWAENTAHPDISVKTDQWCCLPDLLLKESRRVRTVMTEAKAGKRSTRREAQKMNIPFSKDLLKSPKKWSLMPTVIGQEGLYKVV